MQLTCMVKLISQPNYRRYLVQLSSLYTLSILLLVFFTHGCASQGPEFKPDTTIDADRATQTATFYSLETENQTIGDAKVWFEGIIPRSGTNETILQIGIQIYNERMQPIGIDIGNTGIGIKTVNGKLLFEKVESFSGPTSISQKSTDQLILAFAIPTTIRVSEIVAFDLNWTIESDGSRINKTTSFVTNNSMYRVVPFRLFRSY
jgi:hypothetical protein